MRETRWTDWPVVDAEQMREVDRVMVDELGLSLPVMMENAGRDLALLTIQRFAPRRVAVLAGGGGNGGGGLAAARHLVNRGVDVDVLQVSSDPVVATRRQIDILTAMGVAVGTDVLPQRRADVVIDAPGGYGLRGSARGQVANAIGWCRAQPAPVLALDVPSGFDATTGTLHHPYVRATATLTLAALKRGLDTCTAAGELYLGDISVPAAVYSRLGLTAVPAFSEDWVVRVLTG